MPQALSQRVAITLAEILPPKDVSHIESGLVAGRNEPGVTGIPNPILFNLVNMEGLGDEILAKSRLFGNLSSDPPTVSNFLPRWRIFASQHSKRDNRHG